MRGLRSIPGSRHVLLVRPYMHVHAHTIYLYLLIQKTFFKQNWTFHSAMNAHKGLFALNALCSMITKIKIQIFSMSIFMPSFTKKRYSNRIHYIPSIIRYKNLYLRHTTVKFTCGKYWYMLPKIYTVKDNQVTLVSHFSDKQTN